jgi:MinD-like ATPase involved in chromosome partitioning or flagellar assembly
MLDDQAAGLRNLFAHRAARVLRVAEATWPRRGWVALNLAAAFSRAGEQVIVLDAERDSLASLWGARFRYELRHVLDGDRRLVDVMVPGPESSMILPMRRGGATLGRHGRTGQRELAKVLEAFMDHDGLLVVPVSPAKLALPFWRFGGGDLMLCVGEGPVATTTAYASIKAVLAQRPPPCVRIAISGDDEAQIRFEHISAVVKRFLGATLEFAGALPGAGLADGNPGRTLFDDAPVAARSISALAHAIAGWRLPQLELAVRREARRSSEIVTI